MRNKSKQLKCMNCEKTIKGQYKLEYPSRDPICKNCWENYMKYLEDIEAIDDLDRFTNQEALGKDEI